MKTTKEKADALVEQYYVSIMSFLNERQKKINAIKCAILSVKHTMMILEVKLSKLSKNRQENESSMWVLESLIDEQTELLTELESRLL